MSDVQNPVAPSASTKVAYSMNGMAYVPVPLGAIRIGHTINLPGGEVQLVRDDEFKVTQPLREADGTWLLDPLDAALRQGGDAQGDSPTYRKLREIPIRIHVNDPSLVVRARLEAFDLTTRRTVCASNGNGQAKRWSGVTGTVDVACVGCDRCPFANSGAAECKFFGRIAVQIEGQEGELGTYVMRTSSYNTLRTFEAKLWQFWSVLGKNLRGVPFVMKLRAAQSELSNWMTFYFVDLELNKVSLSDAAVKAREQAEIDQQSGFDIVALQEAMTAGLRNGGYLSNAADDCVDLNEFISASRFNASLQAAQSGDGMQVTENARADLHQVFPTTEDATQVDPAAGLAVTARIFNALPSDELAQNVTPVRPSTGIYVPGFEIPKVVTHQGKKVALVGSIHASPMEVVPRRDTAGWNGAGGVDFGASVVMSASLKALMN